LGLPLGLAPAEASHTMDFRRCNLISSSQAFDLSGLKRDRKVAVMRKKSMALTLLAGLAITHLFAGKAVASHRRNCASPPHFPILPIAPRDHERSLAKR
jgi:hypothetical protein